MIRNEADAAVTRLDRVTKHFSTSARHTAVQDLTLDVQEGRFVSVVIVLTVYVRFFATPSLWRSKSDLIGTTRTSGTLPVTTSSPNKEAEQVIVNGVATIGYQVMSDEERWLVAGRSNTGRFLTIAWVFRGEAIRIITAWDSTKEEEAVYWAEKGV